MARKPASYHHGDLRRTLIAAAVSVVEDDGLSALSLLALARKAGVSSGAPYHHFESREQLLAAIAVEGFTLLREEMARSAADAKGAEAHLRALGRGYVRFALAHRGYFRVMFRPELKGRLSAADEASAEQTFAMLRDAIVQLQVEGRAPAGDPRPLLLLAWSAVHGASVLWIDGPLAYGDIVADEDALAVTIADTVIRAVRR